MCQITTNCNIFFYVIVKYRPWTNMPLKCHIYITYAYYFMWTYETTISIYTSCELNAINNVTRNTYTCILHYWLMPLNKHPCHIAHVCPTAYPLHRTYITGITAHTSNVTIKWNFNIPCYSHVCATSNVAHKCHMAKLLNVDHREKYTPVHKTQWYQSWQW